ncbi:MAG: hypothetical protein FJZ47_18125 [Candidatus Tectomicrobia bacterium]|uniref:Uncharacterized protein n=1 Tax=Tectimicrobiota bacterium TaxID=2528274 RepID=A0A937W3U7_UNCTE|nr:hypothetical protein [Candidatus Tectomicrobia bacterium]
MSPLIAIWINRPCDEMYLTPKDRRVTRAAGGVLRPSQGKTYAICLRVLSGVVLQSVTALTWPCPGLSPLRHKLTGRHCGDWQCQAEQDEGSL